MRRGEHRSISRLRVARFAPTPYLPTPAARTARMANPYSPEGDGSPYDRFLAQGNPLDCDNFATADGIHRSDIFFPLRAGWSLPPTLGAKKAQRAGDSRLSGL